MSSGLRHDNLLSSGQKYLTSSDIKMSIFCNIKFPQVCVARARLLVYIYREYIYNDPMLTMY
jgi:hypothetical protein